MQRVKILFYLVIIAILANCSNINYLRKDEMLYVGSEVSVHSDSVARHKRNQMEGTLEKLLRPATNSRFLGLRTKLFFYNLTGQPKRDKGLRHWMRTKMGEPPVLYSQVNLEHNTSILNNYLENKGYFNVYTVVNSTIKKQKAKSFYDITLGNQYRIKNVVYPTDSSEISKAIYKSKEFSVLHPGNPYDLDVIKTERVRINAYLKEIGYFYYNQDLLIVQVDSTVGLHQVSFHLNLKDDAPQKSKKAYQIGNVYVYPNYTISDDTLIAPDAKTMAFENINIFDLEQKFKPQIFKRSLLFKEGELYNRTNHNKSLNRLTSLGAFKFVTNQFILNIGFDNRLDAYYYLTPLPKKSIRLEVLGKTTSADFLGSEINLNWTNRNTFKGAEQLTISVFAGIDIQISGQKEYENMYRYGTDATLLWPKMLIPFKTKSASAYVPRTQAKIGYEQIRTDDYSLNSVKSSFGYLWKQNVRKEHVLNIVNIHYVRSSNITDEYQAQIDSTSTLARITEKQFIFGPSYTYTYTNTMEQDKKNTVYFRGSVDAAGNMAGLISGANLNAGNQRELLGIVFSQYVKAETDFRHYLKLGRKSQLASRLILGAGLPYGNSNQLPFIKQFFAGGINGLRAFNARSVGPGSYVPLDTTDQSGDLKLEVNIEYRTKLFSIVHGALFVDAGNVWLLNENIDKPGAAISKDFLKEIAVGVGTGLRFDFSFLILRTDLAFPIKKPILSDGNRWVINQIDFGNKHWRSDNLVLNLAIGYPF